MNIPKWETQTTLLRSLAEADLEGGGEIIPTLIAFRNEDPLFLASLRPFDRGDHLKAIDEVADLVVLLGGNRVLISLTGRAWSLKDPIPAISEDGDLRQRVLIIHEITSDEVSGTLSEINGTEIGAPVQVGGDVWGPVIDLLRSVVKWTSRPNFVAGLSSSQQIRGSVTDVESHGHSIAVAPALVAAGHKVR